MKLKNRTPQRIWVKMIMMGYKNKIVLTSRNYSTIHNVVKPKKPFIRLKDKENSYEGESLPFNYVSDETGENEKITMLKGLL